MSILDKLFKQKNKNDYEGMIMIIRDDEKQTHLKNISEKINSKNGYFHQLHLTSNEKIKFYIDCKYTGVHLISLAETVINDYGRVVSVPKPNNGKCLKKGNYAFTLDRFLDTVKEWQVEYIYTEDMPKMKHILHGKENSIDMYMVFEDTELYDDFIDYMRDRVKRYYLFQKEKIEKDL